jgi:hypothetical protein
MITFGQYPLKGLESNYCRNPDNLSAAWCYTNDNNTRWELCNVPICEVLYFNENNSTTRTDEVDTEEQAVENSQEACGSAIVRQADY